MVHGYKSAMVHGYKSAMADVSCVLHEYMQGRGKQEAKEKETPDHGSQRFRSTPMYKREFLELRNVFYVLYSPQSGQQTLDNGCLSVINISSTALCLLYSF